MIHAKDLTWYAGSDTAMTQYSASFRAWFMQREYWFYLAAAFLLLFPALLINLGLNPFFAVNDEAIRQLVAFEMFKSGDYITPTTFGEPYLRKPPLYNWLIVASSLLTGEFNEFSSRILTVLSVIALGGLTFYYSRKHFSSRRALLLAFIVMTSGRILIFDSFLGLIDTAHAVVIYWLFMVIYHNYSKGQFWSLFILSYLLTAVGFLMKGLPAIVFQGVTLLEFFVSERQFRKLLSVQHFVGIILFLTVTGTYYYLYLERNDLIFSDLFSVLFDQSVMRTGLILGIGRTLLHMLTFPLEFVYHFAPWSLMVLVLIRPGIVRSLMSDSWIRYNSLVFVANILIYWVSPGIFPRYLFMLLPPLFTVLVHLYYEEKGSPHPSWRVKVPDAAFLVLALLSLPLVFAPLFLPDLALVEQVLIKILLVFIPMVLLLVLMLRSTRYRLFHMILMLLLLRIWFNFFVLPDRARTAQPFVDSIHEAIRVTEGEKLFIYGENYLLTEADIFYLARARDEILVRSPGRIDEEALYIVDDRQFGTGKFEEVFAYTTWWQRKTMRICRLRAGQPHLP